MSTKQRHSRSSGRRRAAGAIHRLRLWGVVAALVVVVGGIGVLKWTETRQGQATLLTLGAQKMYAEVQEAVGEALAEALPGFTAGPLGRQDSDGQRAGDHDWPAPQLGPGAAVRCRTVTVPQGETWWEIQRQLAATVRTAGARVLWGERLYPSSPPAAQARPHEELDLLRLDIGVDGRPTHTLVLHRGPSTPSLNWGAGARGSAWRALAGQEGPVVALLIDDWGYGNTAAAKQLQQLPVPLTMAVLPDLPYSRYFALQGTELILPPERARRPADAADASSGRDLRLAVGCFVEVALARRGRGERQRRREIFLHLPMEPEGYPATDPGPEAIMVGMDGQTIGARLDQALAGLPTITGVNNHMGSAATADAATMDELMRVLRRRNLLFVDSLTSSRSVAYAAAQRAGVPTIRNRIFLDYDNENPETIAANLAVLVRAARASGFALGIGHPHAVTATVLAREVPRLRAAGVRFVTVSEMLALRALAAGTGE